MPARRLAVVAISALASLLPSLPASAVPTAQLRGDVAEWTTGRPVAGATVTLPAYGLTATSARDGTFSFSGSLATDQPFRPIEALVTAPGFGRWTVRGLPLRPGTVLQIHAELRAHAWAHTVRSAEQLAAAPHSPSSPDAYTSTCTGWEYTLTPPDTIKVWITDDQVSKQYDFDFYATHVLPSEWIPSWDDDSLGAGAIAVKTYAWYREQPGHAYSGGVDCADVQDTTADQVFDPTYSYPTTDQAVYATLGSTLWKNGDIFMSQYYAGAKDDPCAPVTGQYAGRMSQWGTQTCALDKVLWQDIVTTFYPDGTEWNDLQNLLLNPRFESSAMYPWTTKGHASLTRTEGGAYEGTWYGALGITKAGETATLRNERPFDGTPDTTYFEKVHLMCLRSANKSCAVTMKVLAIPSKGPNVEQNKVVTVPHDGAWHTYKFWTSSMGIDHVRVRFSITTSHKLGVDAGKLTSDFGGP